MATRNNRDVTMTLSVEALGEDNVDRLKQSVLQLAKEGGDAAPEFQRLADEIDRIGQQGQALRSFQELSQETQELRQRQQETAASAAKLAEETETLWTTVRKARDEQREATEALNAGRLANVEAGNAIRLLKVEYDAAGKQTQEYRDRLRELTQAQGDARANLVGLTQASRDANKATQEAEQAFGSTQKEFTRASKAADDLGAALRRQEQALEDVATTARTLGVATDDIAGAEAQLLQALNQAGSAAQRRAESIKEMAEADRLLAIEERAMNDLLERGAVALRQEEEAQRDAAAAVRAYAEAKEKAVQDAAAWQREADAIVDAAEAARRMEDQTRALIAAQRELAAQRTFEEQADAARRLGESADYIRFWTQALDEADRKAEEAAQAARRLDDAFDSIGIQSAQQLTAEINRIRDAMRTVADSGQLTGQQLKVAFASGENQIRELERELRRLNGTLTLSDQAARLFKNSMGQIAVGNLIADGIASIIERVKEMGRQFIEVTVRTERLQRSLQAIYKDTGTAATQFDVLRSVANQAGVSVNQISDSFVRFSASAHSAGINIETANELFRNLTMAGASLGLTSDQVSGALDALAQMASKGTVSMEELRQQLGDRLPGALGLAAKGLGITEQELIKLVEQGKLATSQFFPAFSQALKSMQGDTNTLAGNWARLTNVLTTFTQAVGDAGGLDVMRGALKALGVALGVVLVPLQGLIEFLGLAGKALGLFAAGLSSGDMKGAFAEFQLELEKSGQRVAKFHKSLDEMVNGADAQAEKIQNNTRALGGNTSALAANAAAQATATSAAATLGNAYVQSLVQVAKNASAAEAATLASEKLSKAKEQEGRALSEAARLSGDAAREAEVGARAALDNVTASEAVARAREREAQVTRDYIAQLNTQRTATGELRKEVQLQMEEAQKNLKTQEAAAEQARQEVQQKQAQAVAARTLSLALQDNSTQVDAYRQRMENLGAAASALRGSIVAQEQALETLRGALERGNISQETYNDRLKELEKTKGEYAKVTLEAASAENLYRDATKDAIANIERRASAEAATLEITKAQLSASQARYQTMAQEAKAVGNVNLALYAEGQARREHIKIMELEIQIQRLQIAAKEKALDIQIASIKGTDDESRAKREQLEIERQILASQRELLKVQEEGVRQARSEADEIDRNNQLRSAGNGIIGEEKHRRDELTQSIQKQTAATRQLSEAEENLRRGSTKDGYGINTRGEKVVAGGDLTSRTGIAAFLRNAGVEDPAVIDRLVRMATDNQGNVKYFNNPIQTQYGQYGDTLSAALLRAAEKEYTFNEAARRRYEGTTSSGGMSTGAPLSPVGGGSKTINISINGRTTAVNVASDADAAALTAVMRELESQANVAA